MEYMRLDGFLGGAVSKLINKAIENKLGYRPGFNVESFNLSTTEKVAIDMSKDLATNTNLFEDRVVVDLRVSMTKEDFDKLMEEVTK